MTNDTDSKTKARRRYESTGRGKTIIKVNLTASDDSAEWDELKESLTAEHGSVKAGIMATYKAQANSTAQLMANRVLNFLILHANMNADYDPEYDDEEDVYGSPDAGNLFMIARQLSEQGKLHELTRVDRSWESGGYSPYADPEARAKHDQLVVELKKWSAK